MRDIDPGSGPQSLETFLEEGSCRMDEQDNKLLSINSTTIEFPGKQSQLKLPL